jgi:hypothetical protein
LRVLWGTWRCDEEEGDCGVVKEDELEAAVYGGGGSEGSIFEAMLRRFRAFLAVDLRERKCVEWRAKYNNKEDAVVHSPSSQRNSDYYHDVTLVISTL